MRFDPIQTNQTWGVDKSATIFSHMTYDVLDRQESFFFFFQNARLMNERLRVWVPAEAAGEFCFPKFTFLFGVRFNPISPQWHVKDPGHRSFCQKYRWQVISKHAYTLDPTKSKWADQAVQA